MEECMYVFIKISLGTNLIKFLLKIEGVHSANFNYQLRMGSFNRLWNRFTYFNLLAKKNIYNTSNESVASKCIFTGF